MQNRDTFSSLHPIISFLFFGLVLVFSMFVTHPACILISLLSALFYSIYLREKGGPPEPFRPSSPHPAHSAYQSGV